MWGKDDKNNHSKYCKTCDKIARVVNIGVNVKMQHKEAKHSTNSFFPHWKFTINEIVIYFIGPLNQICGSRSSGPKDWFCIQNQRGGLASELGLLLRTELLGRTPDQLRVGIDE